MSTSFREKGYYVAKGLIPPELLKGLISCFREEVAQQIRYLDIKPSNVGGTDALFEDLQTLFRVDVKRYLACLHLSAKLMPLFEIMLSKPLVEKARELGIEFPVFQTQPAAHVMSDRLRFENGYFGLEPHQDWTSLHSGLDTLVCWFPITPIRKKGFGLEVIPGSHLLGLCDFTEGKNENIVDPNIIKKHSFSTVEMDPGDVLFFSCFLIHRTEAEGPTNSFRMAFSYRYENAKNSYFVKNAYPHAWRHVIERKINPELFPTPDELTSLRRRD